MSKVPITVLGAEQLRAELKRLKSVERPRIVAAIAEARAHGDLKENAEYHAAKEEQGFIEARIRDIEAKLSNAEIIDVTRLGTAGRVVFGATVDLLDDSSGREVTYRIVGDDEADISAGLISVSSPIARALIGKEEGDVVEFDAPGGRKVFEVIEVRYVCGLPRYGQTFLEWPLASASGGRSVCRPGTGPGLAFAGSVQITGDPGTGTASAPGFGGGRSRCRARRMEPVCRLADWRQRANHCSGPAGDGSVARG